MKRKGFSLVELLFVIVVIGILMALLIPNAMQAIRKADEKNCLANLRALDAAIQMCYDETRDWTQCNAANSAQVVANSPNGVVLPPCPLGAGAYGVVANGSGGFMADMAGHFDAPVNNVPGTGPHS